jgi:hypothetical protein
MREKGLQRFLRVRMPRTSEKGELLGTGTREAPLKNKNADQKIGVYGQKRYYSLTTIIHEWAVLYREMTGSCQTYHKIFAVLQSFCFTSNKESSSWSKVRTGGTEEGR